MCGIAGWIDYRRDLCGEYEVIQTMGDRLNHRGPDEKGHYLSPHAAFAHRRLTVIDPVGGKQPMTRQWRGRQCVMVYNGELYNTAELGNDLVRCGHHFEGYSDTEALLLAYLQWGVDCLQRLNGIFAFAIWEVDEKRLFMARDRLGVKPLFYAQAQGALLFGSEIKALLAHPLLQPELDREGLAELFLVGPARTPGHGIFKGVRELKAGHYLLHEAGTSRLHRYWQLKSRPHTDDLATTEATIKEHLQNSVQRQLISDVPLATFLSGGLDSSAISAIAASSLASAGRQPLHTYSVEYRDHQRDFCADDYQPDSDEPWALHMASELGSEHQRIILDTPKLIHALQDAMRANDYPGMTDIDASLLLFCREIKERHTVALSGEAADEIFGGYPWFMRTDARMASTFPWALNTSQRLQLLSPALRATIEAEDYLHWRYREALSEVPHAEGESDHEARLKEIGYLSISRFMPTLLDRKDRMSMHSGLEVRVPFTDHRLVEYVWNIPWTTKLMGGREKGLLRQALCGLLPEDVVHRPKSPYPKTHNPAYFQAMRKWVLDLLADPTSPLLPLLDLPAVRALSQARTDRVRRPWFGQLMGTPQLFAYLGLIDAWLREYRIRVVI